MTRPRPATTDHTCVCEHVESDHRFGAGPCAAGDPDRAECECEGFTHHPVCASMDHDLATL